MDHSRFCLMEVPFWTTGGYTMMKLRPVNSLSLVGRRTRCRTHLGPSGGGAGPWRVTGVDDPKEIIRIEWGLLAISSSTTGYNGNPARIPLVWYINYGYSHLYGISWYI